MTGNEGGMGVPGAAPAAAGRSPASALTGPICGMTWGWTGVRGTWATPEARSSMRLMSEHGINWTAIAYAAIQQNAQSTHISYDEEPTVTEPEIREAIREAKALNLKVCLKPVVNCADGTWRAFIGFFDWDVPGEPTWTEWFESYTAFILHAAVIAEEEGCDLFCIGCEMVRADGQVRHWRDLIARVRSVYSGLVTYNCDKYQEDRVTWWDAVDVIGSSGYYPIGAFPAELDRIERVVEKFDKPFIFLEAGCPSRTGSPDKPNDWALPGTPSGAEQLRYYEHIFNATASRDWMIGFMFWDWPAVLYPVASAPDNDDYCVYGKPAGTFLTHRYKTLQGHRTT
ncbi:glycoside hydrolase family 113 [Cryobacterium sp. 10C2]|uniref:glycoside hydrolase family 113 n=3 Tax=Cryobacterium TaxID=69578 RepID=UPI002E0A6F63|nr:hypothetical protein [Cryobacterium psychrotolerans]